MGLAEDQGQPERGRGGQTRAETVVDSSCHIAFNLTGVQLFKRGILLKVVRSEWFKVTPLSLSVSQWQQRGEQQQGEQRQQQYWHSHRRAYTIHPQRWSR